MRKHQKVADVVSSYSILALDDDPTMTLTLQTYFQRSGYHVDTENDPYQAIERVRNGHYDILLLDFLMTPICGDQVVEQIRSFNQDLFIILLTGHKSMAPPIKTIRDLEIQGYYEKSDRFDQLELLVESCIKSIKQMRTIQNYQKGLTKITETMPRIYSLRGREEVADALVQAAKELLDGRSGVFGFTVGKAFWSSRRRSRPAPISFAPSARRRWRIWIRFSNSKSGRISFKQKEIGLSRRLSMKKKSPDIWAFRQKGPLSTTSASCWRFLRGRRRRRFGMGCCAGC